MLTVKLIVLRDGKELISIEGAAEGGVYWNAEESPVIENGKEFFGFTASGIFRPLLSER